MDIIHIDELRQLDDLFCLLDSTSSGLCQREDLDELQRAVRRSEADPETLDAVTGFVDRVLSTAAEHAAHSQAAFPLNFEEFVELHGEWLADLSRRIEFTAEQEGVVETVFESCDLNGNGFVDESELGSGLAQLGLDMSDAELKDFLSCCVPISGHPTALTKGVSKMQFVLGVRNLIERRTVEQRIVRVRRGVAEVLLGTEATQRVCEVWSEWSARASKSHSREHSPGKTRGHGHHNDSLDSSFSASFSSGLNHSSSFDSGKGSVGDGGGQYGVPWTEFRSAVSDVGVELSRPELRAIAQRLGITPGDCVDETDALVALALRRYRRSGSAAEELVASSSAAQQGATSALNTSGRIGSPLVSTTPAPATPNPHHSALQKTRELLHSPSPLRSSGRSPGGFLPSIDDVLGSGSGVGGSGTESTADPANNGGGTPTNNRRRGQGPETTPTRGRSLPTTLSEAHAVISELVTAYDELRSAHNIEQSDVQTLTNALEAAELELDSLRSENAELRSSHNSSRQEYEMGRIDTLRLRLENLTDMMDEQQQRADDAEAELAEMRQSKQELVSCLATLQVAHANLEEEAATLRRLVSEEDVADRESLQVKLDEERKARLAAESMASDAKERAKLLEHELWLAREDLKETRAQLSPVALRQRTPSPQRGVDTNLQTELELARLRQETAELRLELQETKSQLHGSPSSSPSKRSQRGQSSLQRGHDRSYENSVGGSPNASFTTVLAGAAASPLKLSFTTPAAHNISSSMAGTSFTKHDSEEALAAFQQLSGDLEGLELRLRSRLSHLNHLRC